MVYSKEYFNLQLKFAEKVAVLENISLSESLLKYTSFFKTFRIESWKFNEDNPIWKTFLNKLGNSQNKLSTINNFYLEQIENKGEKNKKKMWGCFSYQYVEKENSIYVHFRNTDSPEPGALSKERVETRKKELEQMFSDIKKKSPNVKWVKGFSWLYNISSYTRLFPSEYMNKHVVVTDWFKSTGLWGQFLNSAGEAKKDWIKDFVSCIQTKDSVNSLVDCFPLKVLAPKADIKYFYEFYKIK